jgi:predicted amidohydrolase YtcJ
MLNTDKSTNDSLIMHNATFWYGEDARPTEGWMEITGKHITQFKPGKLPQYLKSKRTINLNRAHVLPGFVDCHTHLTVSAWIPCSIDGAAKKIYLTHSVATHKFWTVLPGWWSSMLTFIRLANYPQCKN